MGTTGGGDNSLTQSLGYWTGATEMRLYVYNGTSNTAIGNVSATGLFVQPYHTLANNGVHPVIASAIINPATIINASQGNNINYTATLWLSGATMGGRLGNYSLFVYSGNTYLGGNFNVSGTIGTANATVWKGFAVCYNGGGLLGHCTDAVNSTGGCTCVSN